MVPIERSGLMPAASALSSSAGRKRQHHIAGAQVEEVLGEDRLRVTEAGILVVQVVGLADHRLAA